MPYVELVTGLALLEYLLFMMAAGSARGRYKIAAPATTGHPDFERYLRIQTNTLEQLILVLPCMWIFAHYFDPRWAAGLGLLFVIGRAVYFFGYSKSAERRHVGFMVSAIPTLALLAGALFGAARAALQ